MATQYCTYETVYGWVFEKALNSFGILLPLSQYNCSVSYLHHHI